MIFMKPLSIEAFKERRDRHALIVDLRSQEDFIRGFIPGSLYLGLDGPFSNWAAHFLPKEGPLLLVMDKAQVGPAAQAMEALSPQRVEGYLSPGFPGWKGAGEAVDMLIDVDVDELAMDLPHDPKIQVLDVRTESDFLHGHIQGATHASLDLLADPFAIAVLDPDHNLYIHSGKGYRSLVAASVLKRQDYHNLRVILGGWEAIRSHSRIPLVLDEASGPSLD